MTMIDERFAASVAAWLRRTDRPPRRSSDNVTQAMARVRRTRQHARWSPAAVIDRLRRRRQHLEASIRTTTGGDQFTGLEPITSRGTRTMFTATRVVAAAAIVALAGGLITLNAITPGADEELAPGAEVAPLERPMESWTFVNGTADCVETSPGQEEELVGAAWRSRGAMHACSMSMSDERVSGTFTTTVDSNCFTTIIKVGAAMDVCLTWGTSVLDDGGDGWACAFEGTTDPYAPFNHLLLSRCRGTGANEGWSYVYYQTAGDASQFRDGSTVQGILYEGDPPPLAD